MVNTGRVEVYPKLDGRNMTMVLAPDKKAQAAHEAERKRKADGETETGDSAEATEVGRRSPRPRTSPSNGEVTEAAELTRDRRDPRPLTSATTAMRLPRRERPAATTATRRAIPTPRPNGEHRCPR